MHIHKGGNADRRESVRHKSFSLEDLHENLVSNCQMKELAIFFLLPPHPSQHTSEALKPVEKMPKSRIKRAVFAPEVCLHSRRSAGVGRLASLCVLHLANRAQKSSTDHAGDQSTESRVPTCASAALCCLSCPD